MKNKNILIKNLIQKKYINNSQSITLNKKFDKIFENILYNLTNIEKTINVLSNKFNGLASSTYLEPSASFLYTFKGRLEIVSDNSLTAAQTAGRPIELSSLTLTPLLAVDTWPKVKLLAVLFSDDLNIKSSNPKVFFFGLILVLTNIQKKRGVINPPFLF